MAPPTQVSLLPTPTRCRHCGTRIRWCHSPSGSLVAIDAEPHPHGGLVLVLLAGRWTCESRRGYRALALRELGHELYHYHHCEP